MAARACLSCLIGRHRSYQHHIGARNLSGPDKRSGGEAQRVFESAFKARAEQQLIARLDGPAKTSLIQPAKIERCAPARTYASSYETENASRLSQCFDDHHSRHERARWRTPADKWLVVSHVLHCPDAFSRVKLKHPIDKKQGVAMRKLLKYRADIQAKRLSHCLHPAPARRGLCDAFDRALTRS
jgi:hypothetical protein